MNFSQSEERERGGGESKWEIQRFGSWTIKEIVEITEFIWIWKVDFRVHTKWLVEYNTKGIKPDNVKYYTVITNQNQGNKKHTRSETF